MDEEISDIARTLRDILVRSTQPDKWKSVLAEVAGSLEPHVLTVGQTGQPRPRWETRKGDDLGLTPEQFVARHYAAEKAAVTPRPVWQKNGPYGKRPAEFIAMAYAPEMTAGTLHYKMLRHDTETGEALVVALIGWLRWHKNNMPEGIDIPSYPDWNTRQRNARGNDPVLREAARLANLNPRRPQQKKEPQQKLTVRQFKQLNGW